MPRKVQFRIIARGGEGQKQSVRADPIHIYKILLLPKNWVLEMRWEKPLILLGVR